MRPKRPGTRLRLFWCIEGGCPPRARGLFAGISLEGSTLRPDNGANKNLYGKEVSATAIVFDKAVPVPACAQGLLATLHKVTPVYKGAK